MIVEHFNPDGIVKSTRLQFSQAVRAGQLLFVSGQAGWLPDFTVPDNFEEECHQVFANLNVVLEAAGCGFEHIVEGVSLHTPGMDVGTFWNVRNMYLAKPWPAWTTIGDIGLAFPAMRVEVKVTAVIPEVE